MNVVVLDPAEEEIRMIRDYLESQRPGLGEEFLEELTKAGERILQYPRRYAMYNKFTDCVQCTNSKSASITT